MTPDRERFPLRVTTARRETADAASFELCVAEGSRAEFDYEAGQYLTFEIPFGDFMIERCYSLCSAPGVDGTMQIAVKRVPEGRGSNWMIDHLAEGSEIRASAPRGRFVLGSPSEPNRPLNLFAAGSGITPILSILKFALASTDRPIRLLYANASPESTIFHAALRTLEADHADRLEIRWHFDQDGGFLSADDVAAFVAERVHGDFYVCGPTPFMDVVESSLRAARVPASQVHVERFASLIDPDRRGEPTADAPGAAASSDPDAFDLKIDGTWHRVPHLAGATLLESARAAGLRPTTSCEEGYCGSCMARVSSGDVRMDRNDALSADDLVDGKVLLCQGRPASRTELALDCDAASFRIPRPEERGGLRGLASAAAFALICVAVTASVLILRTAA